MVGDSVRSHLSQCHYTSLGWGNQEVWVRMQLHTQACEVTFDQRLDSIVRKQRQRQRGQHVQQEVSSSSGASATAASAAPSTAEQAEPSVAPLPPPASQSPPPMTDGAAADVPTPAPDADSGNLQDFWGSPCSDLQLSFFWPSA